MTTVLFLLLLVYSFDWDRSFRVEDQPKMLPYEEKKYQFHLKIKTQQITEKLIENEKRYMCECKCKRENHIYISELHILYSMVYTYVYTNFVNPSKLRERTIDQIE